jgi:hypothetical protein
MADQVLVVMEQIANSDAADRVLFRLDRAFFVSEPRNSEFEVIVADVNDRAEARQLIANVAAGAEPNWSNCFRFAAD